MSFTFTPHVLQQARPTTQDIAVARFSTDWKRQLKDFSRLPQYAPNTYDSHSSAGFMLPLTPGVPATFPDGIFLNHYINDDSIFAMPIMSPLKQ